jgi:small GTP-binding protein
MSNIYDYTSKVLIIGDSGSGKSSIINRYIDDDYNDNYYNTIGVDFKIKTYDINDKKIKLHIWDTAGQEKFRSLVTSYYRNSDIIIIVFDLTNNISFHHIDMWYSDIEYFYKNNEVSLYLVGTKADVNKDNYIVDEIAIQEKCREYNMKYFETSAKKNYNIDELFNDIVLKIYDISLSKEQHKILNIEEPSSYIELNKTCLNCNIM